jgi:transposase
MQTTLFPFIEDVFGGVSEKEKELVGILELARIEEFVASRVSGFQGRPLEDRRSLARAFIAKSVYDIKTTSALIERLKASKNLRAICGWEKASEVPSESTFSRAFEEFAETGLAEKAHRALIEKHSRDRLVGHISRDATDIEGREKVSKREEKTETPAPVRKKGRPKKGENRQPKEPSRLEKQIGMSVEEILSDLSKCCDVGTKKKNGKTYHWKGYKLHLDWADGEIPISAILTSASVHDSQAAIPLAKMTAERVINLYDLMDAAYDAETILSFSKSLGHVPIVDGNRRKGEKIEMEPARKRRYDERSTAERGNSLLKEKFGARNVRVKGYAKVFAHLMFGIVALTADRLLNLLL